MTASIRDNQPQQAEILAKVEEIVKSRARTTQSITLPKPIQILDYSEIVIGKELGAGSYSCAYEIKRIGNGKSKEKPQRQFIMKKLSRKVLAHPLLFAACAADLVQEGRILASVNHPNIIQIRAWSGPDMIDDYFQKKSRDKCYLVMDRLDQNMEQKLQTWKVSKPSIWNLPSTRKQLELDLRKEKITNVLNFARALEHLHQHYILHRDLKPGNIGFDAAGTLKVFDFDLSRVLPSSEGPDATFQLTGKVGSPRYMAPEVSAGNPYNLKADVYSFGLLTYQMLTGKTPWRGLDYDWSRSNKKIPKSWSSDLRLALENCQSPDHKQRPSMSTCVTEIEVALTSTNKDDDTIEADAFELGMCGVVLPICSYEDFEELLGCAVGGIPEEEEYLEQS